MSEFFPPDVRLRIEGDSPATAQFLLGPTRAVLFSALLLQERMADGRPVFLQQQIGPGSWASVYLHQGQKIVTIYASTTEALPPPVELAEDVFTIPEGSGFYLGLLNGWWRDGTTTTTTSVTVTGTVTTTATTTFFKDYKPTPATALVQSLGSGFDLNQRLHGEASNLFWASAYTGSLKRAVQAVWALGEIDLPTVGYISGAIASPTKRTPTVAAWSQGFYGTVGLYKAGPQNHWLVEVGSRGVLAMPLILLDETMGADKATAAIELGDTDTARIMQEFGGVPSGEGFPVSSIDLSAAIAAGKVLRLFDTTDMTQPSRLNPYTPTHSSWAFSESGAFADNVGWLYETPGGVWHDGERITDAGKRGYTATRVAYGEHWRVGLELSTHNIANLTAEPPSAIGTGSATLSLVHRGKLDPRALFDVWYPSASNGGLQRLTPTYWRITGPQTSDCELPTPPGLAHLLNPCLNDGWGCNVHVWYEGEQLRRVRWVCSKQIYERNFVAPVPYLEASGWFAAVDYWNVYSPKGFVADGLPDLRLAAGQRSPADFATYAGHNDGYTTSALTTFAAASTFDTTFSFAPGGSGGDTALLRDNVICRVWLILAQGQREGCVLLREVLAGDVGPYPQGRTGVQVNNVWERIMVGRFNGVGEVGFVPPPYPIAPSTADQIFLDSWADRSPFLSGPPASTDSPRPAFLFTLNAGPSVQWGAYNGLIVATSTTGYKKYWNEHVPTELQNYNPLKFGWLGSVP